GPPSSQDGNASTTTLRPPSQAALEARARATGGGPAASPTPLPRGPTDTRFQANGGTVISPAAGAYQGTLTGNTGPSGGIGAPPGEMNNTGSSFVPSPGGPGGGASNAVVPGSTP